MAIENTFLLSPAEIEALWLSAKVAFYCAWIICIPGATLPMA
jgi:hypothetical protein